MATCNSRSVESSTEARDFDEDALEYVAQFIEEELQKLLEEAEAVHKRRFSAAKEKAEAAHSASIDSSRSESVKGEDGSAIAAEEETTVQFKKPKVGAINNLSAGGGARGWQNQNRSDNKAWQGWRSQGDYRMLRPPPKG